MKKTITIRLEGCTITTWRKTRKDMGCASCGRGAEFVRIKRKKSRSGDRIEITGFCQRHAEEKGMKA